MNIFQALIIDALTIHVPTIQSLMMRDVSSRALNSDNSIFDTIYGVANGSIMATKASLDRRNIPGPRSPRDIDPIIRLLCKLFDYKICPIIRGGASTEIQMIIGTLNSWANGLPPLVLSDLSDFTQNGAVELAKLLKEIPVIWGVKSESVTTSGSIISTRNAAASIYGAPNDLEKRVITKAQVKAALKALARAIDAIADLL
jgi:hypothetical protein